MTVSRASSTAHRWAIKGVLAAPEVWSRGATKGGGGRAPSGAQHCVNMGRVWGRDRDRDKDRGRGRNRGMDSGRGEARGRSRDKGRSKDSGRDRGK